MHRDMNRSNAVTYGRVIKRVVADTTYILVVVKDRHSLLSIDRLSLGGNVS